MKIIYMDNDLNNILTFKKYYSERNEVVYVNCLIDFINIISTENFDLIFLEKTMMLSGIDILDLIKDKIDLTKTYILTDAKIDILVNLLEIKKINIAGIIQKKFMHECMEKIGVLK